MPKKQSKLLPKIVILHGWSFEPDLKARWQSLIKGLEAQGMMVEYLDLPGFEISYDQAQTQLEQSSAASSMSNATVTHTSADPQAKNQKGWSLDQYARYVRARLCQESAVVLMGHSFGGQLAVRVAASHPEWLKGLILIGPAGIIDRAWSKIMKRHIFLGLSKIGNKLFSVIDFLPTQSFYGKVQRLFHRLATASDYHHSSLLMKETMKKVLPDEVINDLDKIELPTLIFWGTRDYYTPIKHASIFTSRLSHSHLVILEDEGHRPYFTQPNRLLAHINHFLIRYVV